MKTIHNDSPFAWNIGWNIGLTALVMSMGIAPAALAQDSAADDDDDDGIEEIVVTGSLIRGTPVDGVSPVTVLNRAELEAQGSPSVVEIVRNLGIASGNLGETNQFQANTAEGVATLNLRGLGAERTLVLLNSRRQSYAGYAFGNAINVNHIPSIAIERIEVLREGAAATYGSDAVAGVANIRTRNRFTGLEISGNLQTIAGSGGDTQLGIIWGAEYASNSNVIVSFGLSERGELPVAERSEWTYSPASVQHLQRLVQHRQPRHLGRPWQPRCPGFWRLPWRINQGSGFALGFADPACGQGDLALYSGNASGVCRFRYTPFDNLIEDESHNQLFVEVNHSFGDNARLHIDYLQASTEVPNWKTSPSYPAQSLFGAVQYVFDDHPGLADMQSSGSHSHPCSRWWLG